MRPLHLSKGRLETAMVLLVILSYPTNLGSFVIEVQWIVLIFNMFPYLRVTMVVVLPKPCNARMVGFFQEMRRG